MGGLFDEKVNLYNKYTHTYMDLADKKGAILAA